MASGNDSWNTPPELFEPALRFVGPAFGVDPFPNKTSVVPALQKLRDGFGPWRQAKKKNAWANGPWSVQSKVVEKILEMAMQGWEIFLVQPSSINASYWGHIERAPARCRPYKRVSFMKEGKRVKSNRTDIELVYFGLRVWQFRESYRHLGEVDR